jgi:4-diphosphocytidyl-2-C-methyl-D-erythritol kinase
MKLTVYAPAKINLVLEVLGREGDYHRISSIVQSIDLCDVLDIEVGQGLSFRCDEASLEQDNLVMRTATLLRKSTGCTSGARIELRKRIPWGMGLGGGSSDAAATLWALNRLWGLGLSRAELARLAAGLGSDVPFFLHGGTALVEGKGEQVTPLPPLPATWPVLLVPPLPRISGKTGQMYGRLDSASFTDGHLVRQALSCLREGRVPDPGLMFNVFEKVAFDAFPELHEYRRALLEAGADRVHLAGSGPCLFALCPDRARADEMMARLAGRGLECYLTRSLPAEADQGPSAQ